MIKKIGVIGAGQMGAGIAHVAALAGFDAGEGCVFDFIEGAGGEEVVVEVALEDGVVADLVSGLCDGN